ncbi:hypothetical protein HRG_012517 [Hirsutella rhossiliensis]
MVSRTWISPWQASPLEWRHITHLWKSQGYKPDLVSSYVHWGTLIKRGLLLRCLGGLKSEVNISASGYEQDGATSFRPRTVLSSLALTLRPFLRQSLSNMELTEANLREYDDAFSCSSSPSREESPAAQIRRSKEGIVGILRSLRHFGPQGLKYIDDAEVYIDEKGAITCRGDEPQGDDDAAFWSRQVEVLESKFYPLERATNGPPKDVVINYEAQTEQDRNDQYYTSWKRKMQLWSSYRVKAEDDQQLSGLSASDDSSWQSLSCTERYSKKMRRSIVDADKQRLKESAVRQADFSHALKKVLEPQLSPADPLQTPARKRGHFIQQAGA